MLTRMAIAALALGLVGAGAYAVAHTVETGTARQNVTVIEKNQSWPIKGLMTMEPCKVRACVEV